MPNPELISRLSDYIDEHWTGPRVLMMREVSKPDYLPEAPDDIVECSIAYSEKELSDILSRAGENFPARLARMIEASGLSDPEVYQRAGLDRKLFSKIRTSPNYTPRKKTILALALALHLNTDDTQDLLRSAGYTFSPASRSDIIVRFCLENEIFDLFEVNDLLDRFSESAL